MTIALSVLLGLAFFKMMWYGHRWKHAAHCRRWMMIFVTVFFLLVLQLFVNEGIHECSSQPTNSSNAASSTAWGRRPDVTPMADLHQVSS